MPASATATNSTASVENMSTMYALEGNDVLCGRGTNKWQGNIEFRKYVDGLKQEYVDASPEDKTVVARKVVQLVHQKGGRFVKLKRDANEEVYVEISLERSVHKSFQALRDSCGGRQKVRKAAAMRSSRRRRQAQRAGEAEPEPASESEESTSIRSSSPRTRDESKASVNTLTQNHATPGKRSTKVPRRKRLFAKARNHIAAVNSVISKKSSRLWQEATQNRDKNSTGQIDDHTEDAGHLAGADLSSMDENESSETESMSEDDVIEPEPTPLYERQNPYSRENTGSMSHPSSRFGPSAGPPTHRLIMQRPVPTNTTKPAEQSGWLLDYFMNGGSGDDESYWQERFLALVRFRELHGHCCIAPIACSPHVWASEEEREYAHLADWASVQRHIFRREIQTGRRAATELEKIRLRRLEEVGFVFDYEEFHWNLRYDQLVKFQGLKDEQQKVRGNGCEVESKRWDDPSTFSKCMGLALWVKEQRQLYLDGLLGKIQRMRDDRVRKLERIEFSWAIEGETKRLVKSARSAVVVASSLACVPRTGAGGSDDKGSCPPVSTSTETTSCERKILEPAVSGNSMDAPTGAAKALSAEANVGPTFVASQSPLQDTSSFHSKESPGEKDVTRQTPKKRVDRADETEGPEAKPASHVAVTPVKPPLVAVSQQRKGAVTPETALSAHSGAFHPNDHLRPRPLT